jgi:hypothetical protein
LLGVPPHQFPQPFIGQAADPLEVSQATNAIFRLFPRSISEKVNDCWNVNQLWLSAVLPVPDGRLCNADLRGDFNLQQPQIEAMAAYMVR